MDKRPKLDVKLLVRGYVAIGATLAAVGIWLAIVGPPAPPAIASVTVPVEIIAPPPESQLPQADSLPPPPKAPEGLAAARPFDAGDKRPRIAIVITELGPSRSAAEAAIQHLPPEVTLAFLPFPNDTEDMVTEARAAGHEVLLDIPMEPAGYPDDDPGPDALMTSVSDSENLRRLNFDLARAHGYVGIVNFMGSRLTTAEAKLTPLLANLHERNMLMVDTRANALTLVPVVSQTVRIPYAVADLTIDAQASRDTIDAALAQLEGLAKANGKALGVSGTYPVSFERIAEWSRSLASKGIVLAPVSAVVTMPKG